MNKLPEPPIKKASWPWQAHGEVLPNFMPNGSPWPKITVVTPSYNQGKYIEETIRSVLLQGYPNLEYIIMDGGSTDQTIEVIKKYEAWIDYWVSEPDRGQTHAINKGFEKGTGDIVAWLNSDDYYLPKALEKVALCFSAHPDSLVLGDVDEFSCGNELGTRKMHHVELKSMLQPMDGSWMWHQPGTFVPAVIQQQVGTLDESLHYAFDKDWMFHLLQIAPVHYLGSSLVRFRIHQAAKTNSDLDLTIQEIFQVNSRFLNKLNPQEAKHLRALYHIRLAGLYLIEHREYAPYFHRWKGILELIKGLSEKLAIIHSGSTLKLLRRAILPKFLWHSPQK